MADPANQNYYIDRARAEHAAAEQATCVAVRAAHLSLAKLYEERIGHERPILRVVT